MIEDVEISRLEGQACGIILTRMVCSMTQQGKHLACAPSRPLKGALSLRAHAGDFPRHLTLPPPTKGVVS